MVKVSMSCFVIYSVSSSKKVNEDSLNRYMKLIQDPIRFPLYDSLKAVWSAYSEPLGEDVPDRQGKTCIRYAVIASEIFVPIPFVCLLGLSSFLLMVFLLRSE